jgi:hypothetical protein
MVQRGHSKILVELFGLMSGIRTFISFGEGEECISPSLASSGEFEKLELELL